MSSRWLISDTHFFHANKYGGIIAYCKRPYKDIYEMNQALVDNINKYVTKNDKLYVLGDFSFGKFKETKEIVDNINCKNIYLIKGNHDMEASKMIALGFKEVYENFQIKIHGIYPVLMSHFPYYPTLWEKIKYKVKGVRLDTRYLYKRITNYGVPLLCGHVHAAWKEMGNQYNVGVDVHDMKPVSEKEIFNWLKKIGYVDKINKRLKNNVSK